MTSRTRHVAGLTCAASLLLCGLAAAPASADEPAVPTAPAAPIGPVAGAPGRLSGAAFTDADGDGRWSAGDTAAPDGDLVVATRVSADGTRESGDLVATVEQGRWSLTGLTAGIWLVYQPRTGQTLPAAQQPYRLTIGTDESETRGWDDVDFGVDPTAATPADATLSGTVVDADGHGLAGVVVSDLTSDPDRRTTTGSGGTWTLTGVSYGVHLVSHDEQDHARTPPAHDALLVAGGSSPATRTFTVLAPGRAEVAGTVFDDLDGDGVRDAGEETLSGLHLGLAGTATGGTWDAAVDASGGFVVGELPADTFAVSAPTGWTVTTGPVVVATYTSTVGDVAVGLHRPRVQEPVTPATPLTPSTPVTPATPSTPAPPAPMVTTPAPPGTPARLRARGRAGGVVLRWAAPAGAVVTDYLVEVRRPGAKRWTTLPALDAATTRLTMAALAPGRWWFRVAAVGSAGAGAASRPVSVVVRR
ncbi:hypothetical protein [Nocardioides flavescens]|uniref:hypothetical protein n=1 Tax=Nocardioides flavescens TaxID=2691959 RepID=UPI0019253D0E|nr:hypothetical protein [Nocardioides flavescens]